MADFFNASGAFDQFIKASNCIEVTRSSLQH